MLTIEKLIKGHFESFICLQEGNALSANVRNRPANSEILSSFAALYAVDAATQFPPPLMRTVSEGVKACLHGCVLNRVSTKQTHLTHDVKCIVLQQRDEFLAFLFFRYCRFFHVQLYSQCEICSSDKPCRRSHNKLRGPLLDAGIRQLGHDPTSDTNGTKTSFNHQTHLVCTYITIYMHGILSAHVHA